MNRRGHRPAPSPNFSMRATPELWEEIDQAVDIIARDPKLRATVHRLSRATAVRHAVAVFVEREGRR